MTGGKFDEELARMSRLVPAIGDGDLLLCNESFAATNEREGSEIAGEVIRAMTDRGSTVVFVTHLYELASELYDAATPTRSCSCEQTATLRAAARFGSSKASRCLPATAQTYTAGHSDTPKNPTHRSPRSTGSRASNRGYASALIAWSVLRSGLPTRLPATAAALATAGLENWVAIAAPPAPALQESSAVGRGVRFEAALV